MVLAAPSSSSLSRQWTENMMRVSLHVIAHGKMPYVHGSAKRTAKLASCAVCCAPCCAWSALCRVLCCPIACFKNGAMGMCSDNGCTAPTDASIAACVKDANEMERIERFPFAMGAEDLKLLLGPVALLREHFRDRKTFDRREYALAECVVAPLVETVLLQRGIVSISRIVLPRSAGEVLTQAESHLHNLIAMSSTLYAVKEESK